MTEMEFVTGFIKKIVKAGIAVILVIGVLTCWVTIPQGHVGVVFDKWQGGVRKDTLNQGWHMRLPFVQWIQEYPVSLRTYDRIGGTESSLVDLPTMEGQHIKQAISVVYNIDPAKASFVFDKFQGADIEDIEESFIRRAVTSVATIVAGKASVMDIYGPKKGEIQEQMTLMMRKELEPWGFIVDRVNLGRSEFPGSIETALQTKINAQQEAETAKFKLLQAETDARAKIATAEGEARSNQLILQQLSPEFLRFKTLEVQKAAIAKWNGALPTSMPPNGTVPFININSDNK